MPRKVFTAGEVLAAADVNSFLMDQAVQTFDSAAARGSAIGTATEGMVTWLNDENALQVYDGTQWNGLAASGGNAIINGAFEINQRNFSTTTATDVPGFDRWLQQWAGGTVTMSAQTFTPGAAPVAGYESKNFIRQQVTGQSLAAHYAYLLQRVEGVRSFANETVTVSFWAKADSGTPKVSVEATQFFGTGGSPSSLVRNNIGQVTISTSWARYSVTAPIASISGKTLGTANNDWLGIYLWTSAGTDYDSRTGSMGIQNNAIDFWGVQLEAGPTANVFRRNANSLQGELAACQRYYQRMGGNGLFEIVAVGPAETATAMNPVTYLPVSMRVNPTSLEFSSLAVQSYGSQPVIPVTAVTITTVLSGKSIVGLTMNTASGMTAGVHYRVFTNNTTSGFLGLSAEL
jgi:hypothetical protein